MSRLLPICFLISGLVFSTPGIAQQRPGNTAATRPTVKKPKPITNELSGGLRLNTNGWSVFAERGWIKGPASRESNRFYDIRLLQLEISEIKHPKEFKRANTEQGSFGEEKARPYIFGKINNFHTVKLGYGFRKMIAGKPEHKSVSVHWFGVGGLALGMLKPYYVDAYVPQDNGGYLIRDNIKFEDPSNGAFLNDRLIVGGAGFTKGLNELRFLPGLHLKSGLRFDFAASEKTILAVELGGGAELYTRKIEIMAHQPAFPYSFNLFASFQFGKRW